MRPEDDPKCCPSLVPPALPSTRYLRVDFSGAVCNYSSALSLDPGLSVALYNRGTVHFRMGRLEQAARDLGRAVHRCPDNRDFAEGLRACQQEMRERKT